MMLLRTLVLSGLCAVATAAAGDAGVIYSETFDSGAAPGWTMNGLWHVTSNYPATPNYALGYVQNETPFSNVPDGNYSTGARNSGNAFSPAIFVPLGMHTTFNAWYSNMTSGEVLFDFFDVLTIGVSLDGVTMAKCIGTTNLAVECPHLATGVLGGYSIDHGDLSQWAGQNIYLMFRFNTRDSLYNNSPGARIDNIKVFSHVPEPLTLALFGAGLAGLSATRRRNKRA